MKIALLGASDSGKTVYLSGLSYKFRNAVTFDRLSSSELAHYRKMQVNRRVGFKISVSSAELERMLANNISRLSERPITRWPKPTVKLDKTRIDCVFKFRDVEGENESIDQYARAIDIFDPTGGALAGAHEESDNIVSSLCSCDVCIVFLPSDVIIECAEYDDIDQLRNRLLFGKVDDIIKRTLENLDKDDPLPVCFVISKADKLDNLPQNVINKVNELLYDRIITSFSEENPNIMLCVCPTSVRDPQTGNFQARNLEWPFLFAAGGTIFRNSFELEAKARQDRQRADRIEQEAEQQRHSGWWNRFIMWANGDGVNAKHRLAAAYYNQAGRLIDEAEDDRELARNAWNSLAIEGKARNVRVFMKGKEIDPHDIKGLR